MYLFLILVMSGSPTVPDQYDITVTDSYEKCTDMRDEYRRALSDANIKGVHTACVIGDERDVAE